jgi:NAD(P)-dependent dehydrogenase (short-subunit alcohol dehydrogenase family)
MSPITNQSILVIGGSSGIGAAVVKLAVLQGARVAIASSNATRVADAVKELETTVPNAQVTGYTCDLSKDDIEINLEKLFTEVTAATGELLDHVVYTAGMFNIKPVSDITLDFLRTSGQVGYFGQLLVAKLAPRYLKNSYQSSLTFTSGRIAEKPLKGASVVAGWGAATLGMTRGLALDLAPIRVNAVSPGTTDTPMWGPDEQRSQMMDMFAKTALLGKVGTADEVAEAYIYLMKDSNNTGSCVSTSGGVLLQ